MDFLSTLTISGNGNDEALREVAEYATRKGFKASLYDAAVLSQLPKFQKWIGRVTKHFNVSSVTFRHFVGNPKAPVMLNVIANVEGTPFPVEANIQGTTVALLVLLIDRDTAETYVAYVKQARSVIGNPAAAELIAGREDGPRIQSIAVDELIDEGSLHTVLGMSKEEAAKALISRIKWKGGIWSSMGFLYEFVKVGIISLVVSSDSIKALQGKDTGDEHEAAMTVGVVSLADFPKVLHGDPRAWYAWAILHGAPEYHPDFEGEEA